MMNEIRANNITICRFIKYIAKYVSNLAVYIKNDAKS